MKTLLRVTGLVVAIGAVLWALKDRILPAPQIPDEPPPRFRSGAAKADPSSETGPSDTPDDLTAVKGIGPVYADRLRKAGIGSFGELTNADPATVAAAGRVSEAVATTWIERARKST